MSPTQISTSFATAPCAPRQASCYFSALPDGLDSSLPANSFSQAMFLVRPEKPVPRPGPCIPSRSERPQSVKSGAAGTGATRSPFFTGEHGEDPPFDGRGRADTLKAGLGKSAAATGGGLWRSVRPRSSMSKRAPWYWECTADSRAVSERVTNADQSACRHCLSRRFLKLRSPLALFI